MRWPVIILGCFVALTGCSIVSMYQEHNIAATIAGWFLTFCETSAGTLFINWINKVCYFSEEHGPIVIAVVETFAFASHA